MARNIRVILADDNAVVRKGIREMVDDEPDLVVVGEAQDGQAAIDLAINLHPDIVIMDIHMPVLTGIQATAGIRSAMPDIRVLGLSAFDDPPYTRALLDAGAESYVLVRAIRTVAAGGVALEPELRQALSNQRMHPVAWRATSLSVREANVLQLAAQGLTNKQIGAQLGISDRTVPACS